MGKLLRPRLIITALLLLLITSGIAVLYKKFAGNSVGSVTVGVPAPEVAPVVNRLPIQSAYATFTRSSELKESRLEKPVDPVLVNHSFTKQQFSPWSLGIQIVRLPTGSLSDAGTYNYRNKFTAQFTKSQRMIGKQATTVFVDRTTPGFNQAVYFQNGSRAASVTLSGGTSVQAEAMQAEIDSIITSWQWYD